MIFLKRFCLRLALACFLPAMAQARGSAVVSVAEPSAADVPSLASEATVTPAAEATWLVYGRINGRDFAVGAVDQVRISSADGQVLPLVVESGSVFAEFDEIVAMSVAFELDPRLLAAGKLQLEWGDGVSGEVRQVESISFPESARGRVRVLRMDDGMDDDEAAQFATIDIIADSRADTYFLWYLLPMAMIFTLLLIRKLAGS